MLVLCSNGLSSDALRAAVGARLQGAKRAALVVTADNVYKKENYHVPRGVRELETLGLEVELFDLDEQPARELLRFGAVEFIGGNPFYLMASIRRHGAQEALRQLAQRGVLIGWSAAAFVFGPSLELVNRYSPEMNEVGRTDLCGLALADVEVLPHYSRMRQRFERFEERCREYEAEKGIRVLRLEDGDGVLLDGDERVVCRAQR